MSSVAPQPRRRSLFMTFVKVVLFLLLVAVAAFVGIGMFVLDGKFDLSRDIVIKASPEEIHKQVGDLREWPNWLPFIKHDKSIKTTIVTPTGTAASQSWTSDHGNGKLNFVASDETKGIEYDMTFDEKWPSKGIIRYDKAGEDTRVTWKMVGEYKDFLGKWMALAMPPMVGPMFDEGLKDLKDKVEKK